MARAQTQLRSAIVDICRRLDGRGLVPGSSGNVSARTDDGFLITPSGVPFATVAPSQIVHVAFDGNYTGACEPSSEWRMHFAVLKKRPEAGAVVHVHSPFATALSCTRKSIPAFHYMVAVAGGADIRCADYATFGSSELAENALRAMAGRKACLLANHGMICFGADLRGALDLACEVETLAQQYWRALQIGEPAILSQGEMARVFDEFEHYGQNAGDKPGDKP